MKNIIILGSTGSVGRSALDIVRQYPDKYNVVGLSANSDHRNLSHQAFEFNPRAVCVADTDISSSGTVELPKKCSLMAGEEGLCEMASFDDADIVLIAISGISALAPLIASIKAGKTIALASKEPIVSAGELINKLLKGSGSVIIPVDSEHSAIKQCIEGNSIDDVEKIIITGSGGSLWGRSRSDLAEVTIDEVLDHPKWDMGKKITVDSASLMNKGLELIEARWLFNIHQSKIDILVHPEAIIHSMVQFKDGTLKASMFEPDMKYPIVRALGYPEIVENDLRRIDFDTLEKMTFSRKGLEKYDSIRLALSSLEKGGTFPAVLNASNEACVAKFLGSKIRFIDIMAIVEKILSRHTGVDNPTFDDIIASEKWAIEEVHRIC